MQTRITSLRSRIYLGFAVIAFLLIAVGAIGIVGASRLHQSSNDLQKVTDVSSTVLQIDREVQALQLKVERYIDNGHESGKEQVLALTDKIVGDIEDISLNQSESLSETFGRMMTSLTEFRKHFTAVAEERQIRTEQVQSLFPQQSAKVLDCLVQMSDAIPQESDSDSHLSILRCRAHFSQAEKHFLRYYVSPDSIHVNNALDELKLATQTIASLNEDVPLQLRQKLTTGLKDFQRIGVRAVHATRSYLFLVNVLMAGEASEIGYHSKQLRDQTEEQRNRISADASLVAANTERMTFVGVIIALAAALTISGKLAGLVLHPVTKLTATFKKLAAGETLVQIPGTDRPDEIGQMAVAAGVFSEQNQKQQLLLKESKRLADELARKAEELETTNADLDSFAYVASHDLKSPLRGIRQLASWIDEDSGHLLPETSLKHFHAIQARIERMELLLSDLLEFSRVGRVHTDSEFVDVGAMLRNIVQLIDNPTNVQVSWPDDLPKFETYRIPLEQIFLNLIGNAIKHNDKQSDGIIEIFFEEKPEVYIFHIKDNGPGIDERHHLRVFQMYQRVADPSVDGSGMGLAIVKKQAEKFGGSVTLESAIGKGATFSFSWPISVVEQEDDVTCPVGV